MHDYMKALYHRFDSPAERKEKLEQQVNKTHKRLAGQLGKHTFTGNFYAYDGTLSGAAVLVVYHSHKMDSWIL